MAAESFGSGTTGGSPSPGESISGSITRSATRTYYRKARRKNGPAGERRASPRNPRESIPGESAVLVYRMLTSTRDGLRHLVSFYLSTTTRNRRGRDRATADAIPHDCQARGDKDIPTVRRIAKTSSGWNLPGALTGRPMRRGSRISDFPRAERAPCGGYFRAGYAKPSWPLRCGSPHGMPSAAWGDTAGGEHSWQAGRMEPHRRNRRRSSRKDCRAEPRPPGGVEHRAERSGVRRPAARSAPRAQAEHSEARLE